MKVMRAPRHAGASLDAALGRLERDGVIEVRLDDLSDLGQAPAAEPFTLRAGPRRSGIDDVVLTLCAARRMPEELTVRVLVPPGGQASADRVVQPWVRQVALDASSASWRRAMAVRSMGLRQLPLGLAIAIVAAVVAYAAAGAGADVDSVLGQGVLFVLAGIAITLAWVASWMVIESAMFDWRQLGIEARAYELLAGADIDIVEART